MARPTLPTAPNQATFGIVSAGQALIGRTVITGKAVVTGRFGQLDARLWDLNPRTGTEQLIDRGAYRLGDNQKGSFRFTLDGNGWKFPRGHRIVVELLGRDAPTYGPSPTTFSATLSKVNVSLPVRRPGPDAGGLGVPAALPRWLAGATGTWPGSR